MKLLYEALNPWWRGKEFDAGIGRERYLGNLPERLGRDQIEIFIGGRGTGKTTLLMQVVQHLLNAGTRPATILYLPMHYPALADLSLKEHLEEVQQLVCRQGRAVHYLLVDEFQEKPLWQTEIRDIYDPVSLKLFAAATAPPLVRGPGRPATRQAQTIIYPLAFPEFASFRGHDYAPGEPDQMAVLAEEYLLTGGYPAHVLDPLGGALAGVVTGAAASDISTLHDLRKPYLLKEILCCLASVAGSPVSFRQLASAALRLSANAVGAYIGFLEEAWLVKSLEKWGATPAELVHAPKKIYLGDNGIRTVLIGEGEMASRAENAVFLELWRSGVPCGYYRDSCGEVDFVLGSRARPYPVDVRYEADQEGEPRRYDGLRAFIRRFPRTRKASVVTRNVEEVVQIDQTKVWALPLWKFLWGGGVKLW